MVLHQRKRPLLLGLGLTVALVMAVGLSPATASAAPPTLTAEGLSGSSSQGNSVACPSVTYNVSGTATFPYPGTFEESGGWNMNDSFTLGSTTFTITSGTTTITGSKAGPGIGGRSCFPGSSASLSLTGVPYTATIHTPNGDFHDEGTSGLTVFVNSSGAATLTEGFTSSLTEPVLIAPTSKNQCKNNGWKAFPQFKNQGQCVSFVERNPKT
jgi:hypothetical protein